LEPNDAISYPDAEEPRINILFEICKLIEKFLGISENFFSV